MKYSQIAGIVSAAALMLSGRLHWAWYPDLRTYFTGFVSRGDIYGKPGAVFIFFAIISIVLFAFPTVWAKRGNIFLCAVIVAYAIKSFILYSACYRGICPEPQIGLWLMMGSSVAMLLCALFPGTRLRSTLPNGTNRQPDTLR